MYKVGEHCKIKMTDPAEPGTNLYFYGDVVGFQFPLLTLRDEKGKEITYNLSAPQVVSIERH